MRVDGLVDDIELAPPIAMDPFVGHTDEGMHGLDQQRTRARTLC